MLQNCLEEPKTMAIDIADVLEAEVVQVIGRTIILYKQSRKKKQIVLPK